MPEDNRGGPASKGNKSGDGRPDGKRRDANKRGGPNRSAQSGRSGEQTRAETYQTVKEVMRGADFKIDKSVVADKATHRPMRTEYRLTRQGLEGTQMFSRLADAITASTAPLPEPEPEIAATGTADGDHQVEIETAESAAPPAPNSEESPS